jgi:hypothetical protein
MVLNVKISKETTEPCTETSIHTEQTSTIVAMIFLCNETAIYAVNIALVLIMHFKVNFVTTSAVRAEAARQVFVLKVYSSTF